MKSEEGMWWSGCGHCDTSFIPGTDSWYRVTKIEWESMSQRGLIAYMSVWRTEIHGGDFKQNWWKVKDGILDINR